MMYIITVNGSPKLATTDREYHDRVISVYISMSREEDKIKTTRLREHPDYEAWL